MIGIDFRSKAHYPHELRREQVYKCIAPHSKAAIIVAMEVKLPYHAVVKYLSQLIKEGKVTVTEFSYKDEQRRMRKICKYSLPLATYDSIEILKGLHYGQHT